MMKFRIPIYDSVLHYVKTCEEFDQICEDCDIDEHAEDFQVGLFAQGHAEDGSMVYIIGHFDGCTGTLIHELSHLCLDIIKYRGFSAHAGNGEPFAHLMDWLYRVLTKEVVIEYLE